MAQYDFDADWAKSDLGYLSPFSRKNWPWPWKKLQFSLFQQKLEMIDYCIRQKRSRDERLRNHNEKTLPGLVQVEHDSDEEFFDAEGESAETIDYVDNVGVDKGKMSNPLFDN